MAKIQVALDSDTTVQNEKGERIELPKKWNTSCAMKPTDDCIKCYIKDAYYWSTAEIQNEIFVNGQAFDEWFELQPLAW